MANYNRVLLMGNLTRDPEIRYSSGGGGGGSGGGSAICKFGLAVNRTWKNQSGEKQEETCFVDITVFGRTAENCNEYLSKGRPVFIEGRLEFSQWEDRESGQKRSKLAVVAENVQFLGSRDGGGGGGGGGMRREDSAPRGGRDEVSSSGASPSARGGRGETAAEVIDDIPF